MSQQFLIPSTPPRQRKTPPQQQQQQNQQQQHLNPDASIAPNASTLKTPLASNAGLLTPSTTNNKKSLLDPNSACKSTSGIVNQRLFSFSPTTPQKSPCKSATSSSSSTAATSTTNTTTTTTSSVNNRKRNLNDIFLDSNAPRLSNEKISFGLFLPSPSKIGTGRRINTHGRTSHFNLSGGAPLFDRKKLESFKDDFEFNVEEEEEEEEKEEKEEEEEEQKDNIFSQPQTPGKQLIDDEKIKMWHGKSYNKFGDSDSDDEGEAEEFPDVMSMEDVQKIPRVNLHNPFLDSDESRTQERKEVRGVVDYSTHMELVNNKTGERKVIKLTKNQMKIKPKKLSFQGL
ncbi:uncharacterized protein LODBEIA_P21590 [Lodderomyces beijingensis]|uniref:Uncharacterized protein n=1 Tax=Lodderomyces beijingensis TaxID=1775926 RepID=A0ABP0ZNV0_9ASCO